MDSKNRTWRRPWTLPTTEVLYTKQTLTPEEQAQARANIGAAAVSESGGGGSPAEAVLYVEQNLTPEQQERARANIGAASSDIVVEKTVSQKSVNLFNKDDADVVKNSFITPSNGVITAYNYSNTTGYIPIENGKTYTLPVADKVYGWSTTGQVALYDDNKNHIGKQSGTLTNGLLTVTISNENAAFFRASINNSDNMNTGGYYFSKAMVVEGTEYPSEYIPYQEAETERFLNIDLKTDYVQKLLNPLYKKTIIWNGDSICAGKAFDDVENAWAGRIANRNSMTYKNYAVGGGTITENVPLSGGTAHSICGTVDTMYAQHPDADYIIFEGGTNDADLLGSQIGGSTAERFGTFAVANGYTADFDRETFCGALESIFSRATEYWKGKKIGFIVAHKMGRTGNGYTAETNNRRQYFETAMQICKKWGIPVLNLWDECYLNPYLPHMYTNGASWEENQASGNLYADGQHLLSAGYDYTADIINNWLKTL